MSADEPSPYVPKWLTRGRTWHTVSVLTILVLLAPLAMWGWSRLHPTTRTDEVLLRHPVTALRIDGLGGSVLVRSGPADKVSLRTTRSWTGRAPHVEHFWEGDTLHLRVTKPAQGLLEGLAPAVVVELRVPADVRITARLTSGLADLQDLSGPMDLTSETATLTVRNSRGPLRAVTGKGAIRASSLTSPTVSISVGGGSASVQFSQAPQSISAVLGRGAMKLTVPSGSRYRTTVDAPNADVRIAPGLVNPSAAASLDVRAGSGAGAMFGY
ncbi:hypothetical protein OHB13_37715 (plasmid) [Streptomyces sp. NBC_00440]|uniref:hypothetical protein n=1 Tax=unclassified Streptomyces TaxID=2593676 RepID=UPI002E203B1D|nr:hypothetical protein OG760_37070 [Streptomyces sp. NBC_00963]